jgi:hypothetical protein
MVVISYDFQLPHIIDIDSIIIPSCANIPAFLPHSAYLLSVRFLQLVWDLNCFLLPRIIQLQQLVLRSSEYRIRWPLYGSNSLGMMIPIINSSLLEIVIQFKRPTGVTQSNFSLGWTRFKRCKILPTNSNRIFPVEWRLKLIINRHIIETQITQIPRTNKVICGPVKQIRIIVILPP